jgi:hypothetical protein
VSALVFSGKYTTYIQVRSVRVHPGHFSIFVVGTESALSGFCPGALPTKNVRHKGRTLRFLSGLLRLPPMMGAS